MNPLVARLGSWEELGEGARAVRFTVFVGEQGIPPEVEIDDMDAQCVHALVRDGKGAPLATGRLMPDGRIGRMAVLAPWRGKGLGRLVLDALVGAARERGDARAFLHAQVDAVGFYERAGFACEGERYLEQGIWHQSMARALAPVRAQAS